MTTYTYNGAHHDIDDQARDDAIESYGKDIIADGTCDLFEPLAAEMAVWEAYKAGDDAELGRILRKAIDGQLVPVAIEIKQRRDAA